MSEPLKGKEAISNQVEFFDLVGESVKDRFYFETDIKSALEWMIQQHEKRIDDLILILENQPLVGGIWVEQGKMFREIETHYESIMILEEGLSDVI